MSDGIETLKMVYARLGSAIREIETSHAGRARQNAELGNKLAQVRALLERNGCDCDCDHHHEEHDAGCERCLACRVAAVVGV